MIGLSNTRVLMAARKFEHDYKILKKVNNAVRLLVEIFCILSFLAIFFYDMTFIAFIIISVFMVTFAIIPDFLFLTRAGVWLLRCIANCCFSVRKERNVLYGNLMEYDGFLFIGNFHVEKQDAIYCVMPDGAYCCDENQYYLCFAGNKIRINKDMWENLSKYPFSKGLFYGNCVLVIGNNGKTLTAAINMKASEDVMKGFTDAYQNDEGGRGLDIHKLPKNFDVSPDFADTDWDYTLHEDTGIITLNYYKGVKTDVKIYSHYKVFEGVYKAELADSNDYRPYMFSFNDTIESVTFSNWLDVSSCKDMSLMFAMCSNLKSVRFGLGFDTRKVRAMSGMFYKCASLEVIDLSVFDTEKVLDMSQMFFGCVSLKALYLINFDTKNVINTKDMFDFCDAKVYYNSDKAKLFHKILPKKMAVPVTDK